MFWGPRRKIPGVKPTIETGPEMVPISFHFLFIGHLLDFSKSDHTCPLVIVQIRFPQTCNTEGHFGPDHSVESCPGPSRMLSSTSASPHKMLVNPPPHLLWQPPILQTLPNVLWRVRGGGKNHSCLKILISLMMAFRSSDLLADNRGCSPDQG